MTTGKYADLAEANWVASGGSRQLRGRRNTNTKPELVLRKALHALGGRYRLQRLITSKVTADIVFPRQKVAVFVDGCFWHGCPIHGQRTFQGPNAARWILKRARVHERDERANALAKEAGWVVIRLWECDILADPCGVATAVLRVVRVEC